MAKPGRRLSVRIDAPPDRIHLGPVEDTLSVRGSLRARATLTGLGRPVRNGAIEFRVGGLGTIAYRTDLTGGAGVAMTTLRGFQRTGRGWLIAKTINGEQSLSAVVPGKVVERPSIAVETRARIRLEPGT